MHDTTKETLTMQHARRVLQHAVCTTRTSIVLTSTLTLAVTPVTSVIPTLPLDLHCLSLPSSVHLDSVSTITTVTRLRHLLSLSLDLTCPYHPTHSSCLSTVSARHARLCIPPLPFVCTVITAFVCHSPWLPFVCASTTHSSVYVFPASRLCRP